jgi:hypothetical protein
MASWADFDDGIYVPLEAVVTQASGATTKSLVNGAGPPCDPERRPTAVLARHLATPNYELLWFTRLAQRHGFRPLVVEHLSDTFTVNNPAKRTLAVMPVVTGRSANGRPILRRQTIVKPDAVEGWPIERIVTRTGERLVDYHHRKLHETFGALAPVVADLRDLLPAGPRHPSAYYVEFFKLLQGDMVLFEDFVVDSRSADFFRRTVLPAWRHVVETTNRRPQIVRLGPGRRGSSPLLYAYPASVADDPSWDVRSAAVRQKRSSAA